MENYGAHDWNGEGECPQRWKFKGGSEYKVLGVPLNIDYQVVVEAAGVEYSNEGASESIISWSVEADDYMSEFEKSQMEYDGVVSSPEPTMDYSDIMEVV
jgi:hypothetical protein